MHIRDLRWLHATQRPGGFHDNIKLSHVDKAVSVGSGHVIIDVGYYVASTFRSGERHIYTHTKAAEAVRVGRREFEQCNIDRHGTALEQFFYLTQVDGRVVGAAVINGLTHIAANKHGVMPEMVSHLWSNVRGFAHGHHVHDLNLVYKGRAADQRFYQGLGLSATWLNVNAHSRLHITQRLIW